ncbi:MAG TPA: AAA family ATPase [Kineosporiaceae bacterium]
MPDDPERPDPVLTAEQRYLENARAQLARMRRNTLSLEAHGGNPVSTEYLKATLWRRAQSLIDDPSTSLFFGRTDHDTGERWYIGRRHVADEQGNPVVVDWRAEISRSFYRASRTDPQGVVQRRRFGIDGGAISAYEDELLTPGEPVGSGRSAILAREIERPRVGPMRDIVATIQPEQDEIVRADVLTSVCVQGAPGTGKTAVGLHRAAWLLYAHRERLGRAGVLVIGPNRSFLEHVGAVLPSLGEADVRHTTIEQLTASVQIRGSDEPRLAVLKGDARMAEVLRRAVWSAPAVRSEPLVLPRGVRRWRLPAQQCEEIVSELRSRGVRYAAAREMLPQRLAHALLVQMEAAGDSPDDRVQDAVARSREVRRYVEMVWPALDPKVVLFRLLSDPALLATCADGILTEPEQELLRWATPPRTPGAARWSAADAVLLDELADLLRRTPSLGHVVLDEAQDLSPMQLRAVGRRCSTGSATVLGDIAQGTTPWATPSWQESLRHLGLQGAHIEELDRGFRVPTAVIDFAARLLPRIAPGLRPPSSVRDDPGSLELTHVPPARLWAEAVEAVLRACRFEGSVGVIVADQEMRHLHRLLDSAAVVHGQLGDAVPAAGGRVEASPEGAAVEPARVSLVPATIAKGLEYDHVVVVEPATIADAEPDERTGLRRLYVILTRAVSRLTVVHSRPLPAELTDPPTTPRSGPTGAGRPTEREVPSQPDLPLTAAGTGTGPATR